MATHAQIFPSVCNLRNLQIFFANTRSLWLNRLYWSTASAAGAACTVLDCTRLCWGLCSARKRQPRARLRFSTRFRSDFGQSARCQISAALGPRGGIPLTYKSKPAAGRRWPSASLAVGLVSHPKRLNRAAHNGPLRKVVIGAASWRWHCRVACAPGMPPSGTPIFAMRGKPGARWTRAHAG